MFESLKAALRFRLLSVFQDVRLEKTAEEGAEQVSEALRLAFIEHVQPWDEHLDQIAALTPEQGMVIVGNGSEWVLGDPCDCVNGHIAAANPHGQYQARGEKNAPGGYAGLDDDGLIPVGLLPPSPPPPTAPTAYASTSTTSDAGPSTGALNPFITGAPAQNVTPEGITYLGTLGLWAVDEAGVYEVTATLPVSTNEATTATLTLGAHTVAGLGVDTTRRTLTASVLLELEAEDEVAVTVEASGALVTVGAGATVNIRRIA